jgi:hypothetical protein
LSSAAATLSPSDDLTPESSAKPTLEPSGFPSAASSVAAVEVTPIPTYSPSLIPAPTPTSLNGETINAITSPPSSSVPTFITVLPKLKFTLIETQDGLSNDGLSDATVAIEKFLGSILDQVYNDDGRSLSDYFAGINLVAADDRLVFRELPNNELVRHLRQTRRQSEKVRGTEIIYDGTASFFDIAPTPSSIAKTVIATSTAFNDYLVANIISTGNPELASVSFVYAEQYEEDGTELQNLLPTLNSPNGINEAVEEELPEGTKAAMIIITAAGVTMLTMIILVLTSRRQQERSNRDQTTFQVATRFPITTRPPAETDLSVVSSLTENCATGYHDGNILTVYRNSNDRGKDEKLPSDNRGSLKSVAEINCRGTFSLEKEDDSVLPKSWLKALHADEKSNASLVSTESAYHHKTVPVPVLDTSGVSREPSEHGCGGFSKFPLSPKLLCTAVDCGGSRTNNIYTVASSYSVIDTEATDEEHEEKLLCTAVDCGGSRTNNIYTVASSYSVIDTEATDEEHEEHVTSKNGGFPTFGMTPASKLLAVDDMSSSSNETNMHSTSTSATQFIRDLVWLENKIAMENTTNNNLDELERRVSVTNTKDTKSANVKESEALSVACRDCFIPSGSDVLDGIDIEKTPDGPTVTRIADGSLLQGHLKPGSRIVAIDDVDTKNAPADLIVSLLTSTSKPTHKVTVLQFGSNDVC